jgi:hypothetical protein
MRFYLLSIAVLAHAIFWGAGLSWLVMPGRWRRYWPVMALTVGLTLQSVVVWAGALLNLPGTNCYAIFSEVVPMALLALALFRDGPRRLALDLVRTSGVFAVSAFILAALMFPYAYGYHGLTTGSLGSCDAADYAAGARCFMEFARGDRIGFLGLTEVTKVASVDNFFDFYLKLMHFSPCAIIALNGTVFGCAPHEIIAVLSALFLASAVPIVFWISRDLLGLRSRPSLGIALLFGLSPVNWYAVHQTALAQLLAAQGIGLLTWATWTLLRRYTGAKTGLSLFGILWVAYCLIIGSYSFIVVVCLVPAVAFAGSWTLWRRQYGRFARWLLWILAPLVVASLVFLTRVWSIAERFILFKRYDEGWQIPYLWPEGWLGVVKSPLLHPLGEPYHTLAMSLLVAALVVTILDMWGRARPLLFRAVCLAAPALIGSLYLAFRGIHWGHGENKSYLAYKLFCVFYPGIFPSLCLWVHLAYRGIVQRLFFWVLLGCLLVGIARVDLRFEQIMVIPPHIVDRELLETRAIEADPTVKSLNLMISDMWSRLWANSFLLRKEHFFPTHTYEGRLNTPLRGDWDLNGGLVRVVLPLTESRPINATYSLANTHSRCFVRVELEDGWYEPEHLQRTAIHWIWSRGDASVRILNPHPWPLRGALEFHLRSLHLRNLDLRLGDEPIASMSIGADIRSFTVPEVVLVPGNNRLELRSSIPAELASPKDSRPLGFALFGLEVVIRNPP